MRPTRAVNMRKNELDFINLNRRELMAKMKEWVDKPQDPILQEHAVQNGGMVG